MFLVLWRDSLKLAAGSWQLAGCGATVAVFLGALALAPSVGFGAEGDSPGEGSEPLRPQMYPEVGNRKSEFLLRFRARKAAGVDSDRQLDSYYAVYIRGPVGCGRLEGRTKRAIEPGDGVRFLLSGYLFQGHTRARWCPGRYKGIVRWKRFDTSDRCQGGGACVPVVRRVGRFEFRVRRLRPEPLEPAEQR